MPKILFLYPKTKRRYSDSIMFSKSIRELIGAALTNANLPEVDFDVKYPELLAHGDYATNVALVLSKKVGKAPREIAELIVKELPATNILARTEIAGPGFINFFLSEETLQRQVARVLELGDQYGASSLLRGKRLMYEYTDPNPFKVFHIGHLMTNTIGEALSRMAESQGAEVVRVNYQGDVGLHIGRALYGMQQMRTSMPEESAPDEIKAEWLGAAYVCGATASAESPDAKAAIDVLNKQAYERTDAEVNRLYDIGRRWSLAHFEELYRKLGTKFDHYFFESEVAPTGVRIVEEYLQKGVFEKSEGATIFDGEKYGLHKRVFITQAGLPTYEAKDIGNNLLKFEKEPNIDLSYIFTGNEQIEYMKVVLKAIEQIEPAIALKTRHITHGLMLGADGKKMSSRKGSAPSGEGLLLELEELVSKRLEEGKYSFSEDERKEVTEKVAVASIKYAILRQHFEKNIMFSHEEATSFEGDSGPYLQYTYARAKSILRKGAEIGLHPEFTHGEPPQELEHYLSRFSEVVAQAYSTTTPSYLTTYLIEVARLFNAYYAANKVVDALSLASGYRLALTAAMAQILKNGLTLLGIPVIERM